MNPNRRLLLATIIHLQASRVPLNSLLLLLATDDWTEVSELKLTTCLPVEKLLLGVEQARKDGLLEAKRNRQGLRRFTCYRRSPAGEEVLRAAVPRFKEVLQKALAEPTNPTQTVCPKNP